MIEGESGILAISPPWNMPKYEPSKRKLTWPNGAHAMVYSAENPDLLRGPQHEKAWVDELAKIQILEGIVGQFDSRFAFGISTTNSCHNHTATKQNHQRTHS